MIRVAHQSLPSEIEAYLAKDQEKVDAFPEYSKQVEEAKKRWNSKSAKTFEAVRETLTSMCSGARRCMYCEDSCADEVEHFKPKNLYPELTFRWENYLYSCGACNIAKRDKFAIFDNLGNEIDITRPKAAVVIAPPKGDNILINPRSEDGLHFIFLDLNTFMFSPHPQAHTVEKRRASYTIDMLQLNRSVLQKARRIEFGRYVACMQSLSKDKRLSHVKYIQELIQNSSHPTVWQETKRQSDYYPILKRLFTKIPEALLW